MVTSPLIIASSTDAPSQVHQDLSTVIELFCIKAPPRLETTRHADVLVNHLVRPKTRVDAVDPHWMYVIAVDHKALCVRQADGSYAAVDINKMPLDVAVSFVASIGLIVGQLG
jgi:hypothetical protein